MDQTSSCYHQLAGYEDYHSPSPVSCVATAHCPGKEKAEEKRAMESVSVALFFSSCAYQSEARTTPSTVFVVLLSRFPQFYLADDRMRPA
jgi:hypothetical protein